MFAGGKQAALVLGEGEHTIIEIEKVNLVCGETRVLDWEMDCFRLYIAE